MSTVSAVVISAGSCTITTSTFQTNAVTTHAFGGAVYALTSVPAAGVALRDDVFQGNTAYSGGGLFVQSTAGTDTLLRCQFVGNTASASGFDAEGAGAIAVHDVGEDSSSCVVIAAPVPIEIGARIIIVCVFGYLFAVAHGKSRVFGHVILAILLGLEQIGVLPFHLRRERPFQTIFIK